MRMLNVWNPVAKQGTVKCHPDHRKAFWALDVKATNNARGGLGEK